MNQIRVTFVILSITLSPLAAQERYITLLAKEAYLTNSFSIETNETASLEFMRHSHTYWTTAVTKPYRDGSFAQNYTSGDSFGPGYLIAGPATISLWNRSDSWGNSYLSLETWKITPSAFPTDKTLIIPAGTHGATVTLETSTNLLNWTTATNGFYSGTNTSQFFRINAQRVQ